MPVEFLSDEQVAAYGCFVGVRQAGQQVLDEDVARLSPLGHAHLNCLGRYAFTNCAGGGLRPLREPAARDDTDDEF
jgi:hypothetical protein